GQVDVVDVATVAGHEALVLDPAHRLPDAELRHVSRLLVEGMMCVAWMLAHVLSGGQSEACPPDGAFNRTAGSVRVAASPGRTGRTSVRRRSTRPSPRA